MGGENKNKGYYSADFERNIGLDYASVRVKKVIKGYVLFVVSHNPI